MFFYNPTTAFTRDKFKEGEHKQNHTLLKLNTIFKQVLFC